jgi:hypothetical protein
MIEAPKVQSILSSQIISEKEANDILSKFLVEQKRHVEDAATDANPSNDETQEDYFDIEDDENVGTFEEIETRLQGIVRSLSGIKKPVITNIPSHLQNETTTAENDKDIITSPIKEESKTSNDATPSEISKSDSKEKKKIEKEARRSAKKAEKEAKRAEKEARRAEKKAKKTAKKAAKEAKKEAKEKKLKRKSTGDSEASSAKRVKKE